MRTTTGLILLENIIRLSVCIPWVEEVLLLFFLLLLNLFIWVAFDVLGGLLNGTVNAWIVHGGNWWMGSAEEQVDVR